MSGVAVLFPPREPGLEPGIARWPHGVPLPEPWYSADCPELLCELDGRAGTELWPLIHYPPHPDFGLVDGELLICRRCAEAVRP